MTLLPILPTHRSIKSQVIIYLIFGLTFMTLVTGFFTAKSVNRLIQDVMLKNAFQISEGLATRAVFPVLSGSEENAEEAMAQVRGFQSVVAARLIVENSTDTFSKMIKDRYVSNTDVNDLLSLAENEHATETSIVKDTGSYWLISTPIKLVPQVKNYEDEFNLSDVFDLSGSDLNELSFEQEKTEIIGYAEIIYNKQTLKSTQKRIVGIIISVGTACVMIFSVFLHFGFIRLFQPLQKLVRNMRETEKTGSYTQVNISGAKEIRVIANAYNKMISSLHYQEKSLKRHRDQLESEVEFRTKEFLEARDSAILASQHKTEFMANMSHELRTPIQSIIGYGELIAEEIELEGDPALLEDLDKIMTNSTRLLSMINGLLDLAKIESGHMDVFITEFSFDDMIRVVHDTVEPLALKNRNTLNIDINNEAELLHSDKQKLEHVLINLLSNACKFTSDGTVSLKIDNNVNRIIFEVKDSGIGLTSEQQEYIFDEFRQVDSGDARLFGGTGLGLAICKKFVELLGGLISVSSVLDQGSVFKVEIPHQQKAGES